METEHIYSVNELIRLREKAQRAIKIQSSELEIDGWSKSDYDIKALLDVFKPLRAREGIIFKSYLYRSGLNGNGIIRAVQASENDQASDLFLGNDLFSPPNPKGSFENLMDGIQGDGSPWSYMCASLFLREALAFGEMWHGISWGHFHIYVPNIEGEESVIPEYWDLDWRRVPPDFTPQVTVTEEAVVVKFYTFCGVGASGVFEHIDTYKKRLLCI
ncbi:hypothetical protein OMP38_03060 [Cohnella ginsengisoli]|uniref:Uncharacterized protein n=1 Tax=Cohnella ginsengisoli TaxID=425004 RepID=A0A9X4KDC2_9BACL|nr:hypothetical protein [Cohnella ginsengisoli]MDG0789942.1 hypothetical protein [Cohnella ginsengisoli]